MVMGSFRDITGERYGTLVAISPTGKRSKGGSVIWMFQCDCGNKKEIPSNSVVTGGVKSCGCLYRKHGMTGTRLFNIWVDMRQRCSSKIKEHKWWAGKGIKVCDEWQDFNNFKEWALKNGYTPELTIDRINGDGNYEPQNCRWATYKQQANNNSRNRLVEINGIKKSVGEWCNTLGIVSKESVYRRVREYGWSYEKALTTPNMKTRKRETI